MCLNFRAFGVTLEIVLPILYQITEMANQNLTKITQNLTGLTQNLTSFAQNLTSFTQNLTSLAKKIHLKWYLKCLRGRILSKESQIAIFGI